MGNRERLGCGLRSGWETEKAANERSMLDSLSQILVAIANGLYNVVQALGDVRVFLIALTAVSLLWLAAVEIEELDRQGAKPIPRRH